MTGDTGLDFKATGKASNLLRDTRFDTQFALRIPDPKRTVTSAGGSIPNLPAITLDGQLEGDREQGRFNGQVDVGSTQLETRLEIRLPAPRLALAGKLSTRVLQLGDFLTPGGSSSGSSEQTDELAETETALAEHLIGVDDRLVSDRPLRFDLLHHADIELVLTAGSIEGERIRTGPLELVLRVANGRMEAHHKKLQHGDSTLEHAGGAAVTSLEINNATDPPEVSLKGRANDISLGALHAQISDEPRLLEGLFSYDVDLTGSGRSTHALLSTANGRFGHVAEHAKLTGGDIDLLTFGALQLLMATVVSMSHTTIDCAIVEFKMDDGLATAQNLFLLTPKLIASSAGQLDFGDETVDILVNTEAKRLVRKRKTVLHIHGPMKHLEIDADLGQRALGGAVGTTAMTTAVIAVPPVGFSMAGLTVLGELIEDGENSPCIPSNGGGTGNSGK